MAHLFFDVETTGLPINYRAPYTQVENWPRIVQLSWLIADSEGKILKESDNIIKVDFKIPRDASRIHGITNAISLQKGIPLAQAVGEFLADAATADCLVCHNVGFDLAVLQSELMRAGMEHKITKKTFCTMVSSTRYCGLPGNHGYKWPQLAELYRICFGKPIKNAHNAMADVRATHKIFYHLVREKVFSI